MVRLVATNDLVAGAGVLRLPEAPARNCTRCERRALIEIQGDKP